MPYNAIPAYISLPDTEPKHVCEKDDAALRSQARHGPDPEKREAAQDELDRRAAKRAKKRKAEREERERKARRDKLRPHARRRYFERHGRKPTQEQLETTVDYMIEDGEHESLPDADALGHDRPDNHLPEDLAQERARERARQQ